VVLPVRVDFWQSRTSWICSSDKGGIGQEYSGPSIGSGSGMEVGSGVNVGKGGPDGSGVWIEVGGALFVFTAVGAVFCPSGLQAEPITNIPSSVNELHSLMVPSM
jgi:hypothetical protein